MKNLVIALLLAFTCLAQAKSCTFNYSKLHLDKASWKKVSKFHAFWMKKAKTQNDTNAVEVATWHFAKGLQPLKDTDHKWPKGFKETKCSRVVKVHNLNVPKDKRRTYSLICCPPASEAGIREWFK